MKDQALDIAETGLGLATAARRDKRYGDTDRMVRWKTLKRCVEQDDIQTIQWLCSPDALLEFEVFDSQGQLTIWEC